MRREIPKSLEALESSAERYLTTLGLTWEGLKGKRVLDIGAGEGDFAVAAEQHGVGVVSLDLGPEEYKEKHPNGGIHKDINYVKADSGRMPFKDESFDLIVSHGFVPAVSKQLTRDTIIEAIRLLKPGGEFRFGPAVDNSILFDEQIFTAEEERVFTTDQRVERLRKRMFEFLSSIDSDIEYRNDGEDGYYFIKK